MNLYRHISRNVPFTRQLRLVVGLVLAFGSAWITRTSPADETGTLQVRDARTDRQAEDGTDAEKKTEFLRLVRDKKKNPISMETSITSYTSADGSRPGVVVDLIGAVHVAEPEYYAALNDRFTEYEAVLYELVAPEGTRVPKGGVPSKSGVSLIQAGMTKALNLAFQLDEVDYTQENFVHADLSPDEFAQSMKDRGESVTQMFFRVMGHSMAQQSKKSARGSDIKMLTALFSRDRDHQLKVLMAEQFADMDGALTVLDGPNGSTLVTVRNTRAVEVLKRELRQGKKKLAIFYGAAHLPDLEKQLLTDLNLKPTGQEWLQAWDLTAPRQDR